MATYTCSVWFERDRANVRLDREDGSTVFDLWDEDVVQAIEDGYLRVPPRFQPTEEEWLPCVIDYARSQGLIED